MTPSLPLLCALLIAPARGAPSEPAALWQEAPAPAEVRAVRGRLILPLPLGWRVSARAEGWTLVEGPRVTLVLGEPPGGPDLDAEAVLERHHARLLADGSCGPGRPRSEPLPNGWQLRAIEHPCRDPDGQTRLKAAAVLADSAGAFALLWLQYPDASGRDEVSSLLAGARRPPPPPTPRGLRALAGLLALLPLLSLAALGAASLRAARRSSRTRSGPAPTRSGSLFPIDARETYCLLGRRFLLVDRAGRRHGAFCRHWPSTLARGGAGLAAAAFLAAAAGLALGLPVRPSTLIYGCAQGALAGAALALAGLLGAPCLPLRLRLKDEDGTFLLEVRRRRFALLRPDYSIVSPAGAELAVIRRARARLIRKHWLVLDSRGEPFLALVEKSLAKSLLRRMLGHCWGLLRSELRLHTPERPIGRLERDVTLRNRFFLHVDGESERRLDHRVLIAAALFVEVRDPDRWHPWPF